MHAVYNKFAASSLERIGSLSDGVFSIAMTLLVLDLHVPNPQPNHTEADLWSVLVMLGPRFIPYLMTFLTLGIFWVGQQTQLNLCSSSDRNLAWIQLVFLLTVTLTPFSTALLAQYEGFRIALLLYWLNILAMGLLLLANWRYVRHAGLLADDAPPDVVSAVERRIVSAQILYAAGAALCVVNTYVSIGFMVLVQLNYALAPKVKFLYRL